MLSLSFNSLSAESLPQPGSGAATSNALEDAPENNASNQDALESSSGNPTGNPDVIDTMTELFETVNLPMKCELVGRGVVAEFRVGAQPFSGSYSVWRDCDDTSPLVGLFLARPILTEPALAETSQGGDLLIVLKRPLEAEDDLIPFQLALSEQLDQKVIWGATRDAVVSELAQSAAPSTSVTVNSATATASPSYTSTSTPTPAATATAPSRATPTASLESGPESESVAAPTAQNDSSVASAVVEVETLNMRSGPGINYPRVGLVVSGDLLTITGKVGNCFWIQFQTPSGMLAWVSGGSQFVRIDGDCSAVPTVTPPPVPTPAPTRSSTRSSDSAPVPAGAEPDKGCYLIENFLGVKLTFTMTRSTDGLSRTFTVPVRSEQIECFDPGPYTYTIDAPPPWNSINGKLDVAPGDELRWAVGGE